MTADDFATLMGKAAGKELEECLGMIRHCLEQLTEEQIWWRPSPNPPSAMNSIGNLILHLHGNARQWLVAGLDGKRYDRDRPGEFAANGGKTKAELLGILEELVRDAKETLVSQNALRLLEPRVPQTRVVTGLGTIFHSVPHFRGHTQEIVHISRSLLGDDYVIKVNPEPLPKK